MSLTHRLLTALGILLLIFAEHVKCVAINAYSDCSGLEQPSYKSDVISSPITLPVPIKFYNWKKSTLYINVNGLISFDGSVSGFSTGILSQTTPSLIAPYWAHIDLKLSGALCYVTTNDTSLLRQASVLVQNSFLTLRTFIAKWLIFVNWDSVTFAGATINEPTNSFQVILITDGTYSFVLLQYSSLSWTTAPGDGGDSYYGLGGVVAQAGLSFGDGVNYYQFGIPNNQDPRSLLTGSNVGGYTGTWLYRIDNLDLINATNSSVPVTSTCTCTSPMASTNTYGGLPISSATSLALCQSACCSNTGCTGFDWNTNAASGSQCFLSGAWTSGWNVGGSPGVSHYNCSIPVSTTAVQPIRNCVFNNSNNNSNVLGGVNIGWAMDLDDCKTACANNLSCTGIDWNTEAADGLHCWIHGFWSSGAIRVGLAPGVNHYEVFLCSGLFTGTPPVSATPLPLTCNNTWSSAMANTNLLGGVLVSSALTLADCLSYCISQNTSCTGVDYNTLALNGYQCWMSGPWSSVWVVGNAPGIYHYNLTQRCFDRSSCQWSTKMTGINILGGTASTAATVDDCKRACQNNVSCTSIDWNPQASSGYQCWLHGPWSGLWNSMGALNVEHYNLTVCISSGLATTIPPVASTYPNPRGNCSFSAKMSNTNVNGGIANGATSVGDCQQACRNLATCVGIDWNNNAASGSQCWLTPSTVSSWNLGTVSGIDHYNVTSCGGKGKCTWSAAMSNTNQYGGNPQAGISTISDCQSACEAISDNCTGIDFNSGGGPGQQCWLSLTWSSGYWNVGGATGIVHYNLTGCGSASCAWSSAMSNTNVVGGTSNSATSLTDCQTACCGLASCTGIDWNTVASTGSQCWLTSASATSWNLGTASGITHYNVTKRCKSATCGSSSWTSAMTDTNVLGGTQDPNGATDLPTCKTNCCNYGGCIGIDWNGGASSGNQCWFTTASSTTWNVGTASGIQHFNYTGCV